jgi:hypothetical protein
VASPSPDTGNFKKKLKNLQRAEARHLITPRFFGRALLIESDSGVAKTSTAFDCTRFD